jgi:hypothetical protein
MRNFSGIGGVWRSATADFERIAAVRGEIARRISDSFDGAGK